MQSSVLPLNFTTFYLCGIRPFTKITQRNCVNLLLKGVHPTSNDTYEILSDSVCSHYVNGNKSIKDELRLEILRLSSDDLKKRINSVGIQEPMLAATALQNLIEKSSLQKKTKTSLLNGANSEDPEVFIAKVFNQAIRATNVRVLTSEEKELLKSCTQNASISSEMGEEVTMTTVSDVEQFLKPETMSAYVSLNNEENDEEEEWLMDYLPSAFVSDSLFFAMNPVRIESTSVNMPIDYRALVNTLKPMLTENTLQKFSFADFIKAMAIDEHDGRVMSGLISYWVMRGTLKSICASIDTIDFSQVSDFAIQVIGQYNLDEVAELTNRLKNASNQKANILTALIYMGEASEVELRIITHICPDKVRQQLSSDEDTQIYHLRRG